MFVKRRLPLDRPMELRKEFRYRLEAPAFFFWEGGKETRFYGEGITRDISLQGAYIVTGTNPPPRCSLQLDLLLPPISGVDALLRISGKVRVVRVDLRSGKNSGIGFAVLSDGHYEWSLSAIQAGSDDLLTAEVCSATKAH